jgi:hypothetical protein
MDVGVDVDNGAYVVSLSFKFIITTCEPLRTNFLFQGGKNVLTHPQ